MIRERRALRYFKRCIGSLRPSYFRMSSGKHFQKQCLITGISGRSGWFEEYSISVAHTDEDIDETLNITEDVLKDVKDNVS